MRGYGKLLLPWGVLMIAACTFVRESHSEALLRSKAVELGLTGSIISVEGVSSAIVGILIGQYRYAGRVPVNYAFGLSYRRVSDVDELEMEGAFTVLGRIQETSAYAFAGLAAAIRQEWIGSFSHDRYAVGIDAGLKFLASASAAGTITYQYRRVFNDPVSDFNEHRLTFGISILFGNREGKE